MILFSGTSLNNRLKMKELKAIVSTRDTGTAPLVMERLENIEFSIETVSKQISQSNEEISQLNASENNNMSDVKTFDTRDNSREIIEKIENLEKIQLASSTCAAAALIVLIISYIFR